MVGLQTSVENQTKARETYRTGWNENGEFKCALCQTQIGKNLLGEQPFLLAREHVTECVKQYA